MWFSMVKISWNALKFPGKKHAFLFFVQGKISWNQEISSKISWNQEISWKIEGLQASSLQSLKFTAIFRDGFPLRLELNGWSKIRDPVTAKFKHVTVIVTCTLLCCDDVTYVPALWNFQKADLEPYPYGKKYTTFSFPIHGALASNICLRDAPTCSCIQLYT